MIIIPESTISEIATEIGYPVIPIEKTEIQTKDQLKNLIIWPSMREFFTWFPKINEQEYQVTSNFDISFPNPETFTVANVRMNTAGFIARDATNPFVNNSIYRSVTSYTGWGGGQYGTVNDYEARISRFYDRLERASVINYNAAIKYDCDDLNRKITGFTNVTGRMIVRWCEYSEDWNRIPFQRQEEVIKYAKSRLLRYVGQIRGQQNTGIAQTAFNFQLQLDRAKELEEQSITKWKKFTKVVLLRSSGS
jgi:hypothetical protein